MKRVDGVPVQRAAVLPLQQHWMLGWDMCCAVVVDERDELWVQREVAVIAQLADRDV